MTDRHLPTDPIRVRLEYTARLIRKKDQRFGFKTDKKITALRVLLRERFGAAGEVAAWDWLTICAKEQLGETWAGGPDAA